MRSMPYAVGKLLENSIARVRRGYALRGAAFVGIAWILTVVTVMLVDAHCTIFDDRLRWAMTVATWVAALVAAVLGIVRPLRRPLDLRRMAKIIDARHPEQEERLSTLVELSERDARSAGFSPGLFALVCDLAESDAAKLDFRREFPLRRPLRCLLVFAVFSLSLIFAISLSPHLVGRLFVRAVAPWVDVGNLYANEIEVEPGDLVVLSGTVIRIEARSARFAEEELGIRLSRRSGLGWTEETMEPMAGGVYETTADLNEREWRYRVTAGPAVSRYYYVRVSEMPRYDLFTATVAYPAYTGTEPLVVSNADVGAIRAIAGSKVTFNVKVPDSGTLFDFRIDDAPTFEHVMVSNRTAEWSLDLVNRDGFRAEKGRHPLTSFVDQPPTVVVEKPTGTLRLPPHAKIPVEITASDDVAVTAAYLRVSIDGEEWSRHYGSKIECPPVASGAAGREARFLRTVADVDLSLYDLVFANNIRFDVVVEDGCPPEFGGPHSATSMPFTVQFAANESSYGMQELREEVKDARRDIDEARRRLNDAQNLARQVRDELRRNGKVQDSTEQKSERLAHELEEARQRVEELRGTFAEDERMTPLTKPLDRMLEESVNPALEKVENSQFREREERADEIDAAIPEMADAVQELDELTKRLNERADRLDTFERMKDLQERQEALARAAKDIQAERPLDTRKLEAWKRLEEEAMRRADELLRKVNDPELREARRKMESAAREMDQLKRAIDQGNDKRLTDEQRAKQRAQDRQRELEQRRSHLQNAANFQKTAEQALQRKNAKQAEDGQRMAEDFIERGQASELTRQLQKLASAANRDERPDALALQRQAGEALRKEIADLDAAIKAAREAQAKPEAANPEAEAAREAARAAERAEELKRVLDARAKAARQAAEKAIAEAKAAQERGDLAEFAKKADQAFDAARDEATTELARPEPSNGEALRETADAMAAMERAERSGEELAAKVAKLQKEAKDALTVSNTWKAKSTQGEVVKAQRIEAEETSSEGEAAAARDEANRQQREAAAATAQYEAKRNDLERKKTAIETQQLAIEREAAAQAAQRTERAKAKLAAAERELAQTQFDVLPDVPQESVPADVTQPNAENADRADEAQASASAESAQAEPKRETGLPTPQTSAERAADEMRRGLRAQAEDLNISQTEQGAAHEPSEEQTSGGGVADEVRRIAAELKRDDDPNFFRKLFSHFGWFRVQGTSKEGLGERDLREVPPEYRDLVRRYFLKVTEER